MTKTAEKSKYIDLRSQGMSMTAAAGSVDVALSTAERWEDDARNAIVAAQESRFIATCQRYAISRLRLLERLGEVLNTLDDALDIILNGDDEQTWRGSTAAQVIGLQLKTIKQVSELLPKQPQAPVSPSTVQVAQIVGLTAENGSNGLVWSENR